MNKKRVQQIYREKQLTARYRGGRERAIGTRRPIEARLAANQRWSLDFVYDPITDGRRFRILTVIDNCTRECVALVADTSLSNRWVARARRHHRSARAPYIVVSDNGAEYTANAISAGPTRPGSAGATSRRARPRRTYNESFNSGLRDELLNETLSARCSMPAPCLRPGGANTTKPGRTPSSAG